MGCEVVTHLHLAPWVRLWSFIHSTIYLWHDALPFTIFPLFELILLHAYKFILHCIWSFYSTAIHICKSCDFFYLNLWKECFTNSSKNLGVGREEWVSGSCLEIVQKIKRIFCRYFRQHCNLWTGGLLYFCEVGVSFINAIFRHLCIVSIKIFLKSKFCVERGGATC